MEGRGSEEGREGVRANESESVTGRYNKPVLPLFSSSLFFLHSCSTPHMDVEMAAVVFLFAGQWSCSGCHRSLWLDVCEECLCMALHVH